MIVVSCDCHVTDYRCGRIVRSGSIPVLSCNRTILGAFYEYQFGRTILGP